MGKYDRAIGLRVGIVTGVVIGVMAMALTDLWSFWALLCAAVLGGAAGYWTATEEPL